MAIAAAMSGDDGKDEHEHDIVMPGFRFHPTEEELIEFYLRRKVEGKRFNIELISFLDLYHYDPWELPPLAAIGEKEWFFYVPRDRKYRNGDRPNRVTRSGYWKATGADRTIRGENSRSIGLKKTLVFYSGKAPKGIRTSWIMNEYRLPQCEATRHPKAEISLCRVYKRSGVEDRFRLSSRQVSSRGAGCDKTNVGCPPSTSFIGLAGDSSSSETEKIHKPIVFDAAAMIVPLSSNSLIQDGVQLQLLSSATDDELNRLLSYNQSYLNQLQNQYLPLTSQPQLVAFEGLHNSLPEKLWDWNKQLRG